MPKKQAPQRKLIKRLGPSRTYRYYDRQTGKRVSKERYYQYGKKFNQYLVSIGARPQKKKERLPGKRGKGKRERAGAVITREKVKGKFFKGENFVRRCRVSFIDWGKQRVIKFIIDFVGGVLKRFNIDGLMYIQISGFLLDQSGDRYLAADGQINFFRNSSLSFVDEFKIESTIKKWVTQMVESIYGYLGDSKYVADDFIMTKMQVNQREQDRGETNVLS